MRPKSVPFGGLILALAIFSFCLSRHNAYCQQPGAAAGDDVKSPSSPRYGVVLNDAKAYDGYTLIYPLTSKNTYLIDMLGRVVRKWESKYQVGQNAHLLENGNLLRSAKVADSEALFAGAGGGGRIQEFSWDGKLLWDFKFHNDKQIQHHAITPMPNGNILLIVWERRTPSEAIAAGVKPALAGTDDTLVDSIFEIQKMGLSSGKVVWKWHVWDHLIQDHDQTKANFGDVAKHPERIDANFVRNPGGGFGNLFAGLLGAKKVKDKEKPKAEDPKDKKKDDALAKLQGLGYVGGGGATSKRFAGFFPDWTHVNAVSYNPDLDQIMISSRMFSEAWIIDHSTTAAEAATSKGGKYGKGGDLLFRWGNPRAYRAGGIKDQRLFVQHDAQWIRPGLPGAGNLLAFNNGTSRPGSGNWSSADEVVLPVDDKGRYELSPGSAWGPKEATWSYSSTKKTDFYSVFMSSARRMPNGNTLIATGFNGSIFEVTANGDVVWRFIAPLEGDVSSTLMFRLMGLGGRDAGAALFSAHRYGPDFKGFAGKELKAGDTIEELTKAAKKAVQE